MPQWYETSRGQDRLERELDALAVDFPQFDITIFNDGTMAAVGYIGPGNLIRGSYYVVAEFPYTYGNGRPPRVFLPYEEFPRGTPHLFGDGSICIEHGDFGRIDTIATALGWVAQWLALYEEFKRTGKRW